MRQTPPGGPSAGDGSTDPLGAVAAGFRPAATALRTLVEHEHRTTGAVFDLGLAWPAFRAGEGGLGAPDDALVPIAAALRSLGVTDPYDRIPVGYALVGPVLAEHATPEQRQQWLRRTYCGGLVWCQLFSEPDAGSDLASLRTTAFRDGDDWRVSGVKVWTTLGHIADRGLLLARTDPAAAKHAGITAFALDMHAPGVTVHPLRQLTGDAEFNHVAITDAVVSDADRIGEPGDGWAVALTTLRFERQALRGTVGESGAGLIERVIADWSRQTWSGSRYQHAVARDRLAALWARARILALTERRHRHERIDATQVKLLRAHLNRDVGAFAVDQLGAAGQLYPGGYRTDPPARANVAASDQEAFLRSRANTIEGGTSEILRTLLGERTLGLPRGPR